MKERIRVGDYVRVTKTDYAGKLKEFLLANDVPVVKRLNAKCIIVEAKLKNYSSADTEWALHTAVDTFHKVEKAGKTK